MLHPMQHFRKILTHTPYMSHPVPVWCVRVIIDSYMLTIILYSSQILILFEKSKGLTVPPIICDVCCNCNVCCNYYNCNVFYVCDIYIFQSRVSEVVLECFFFSSIKCPAHYTDIANMNQGRRIPIYVRIDPCASDCEVEHLNH